MSEEERDEALLGWQSDKLKNVRDKLLTFSVTSFGRAEEISQTVEESRDKIPEAISVKFEEFAEKQKQDSEEFKKMYDDMSQEIQRQRKLSEKIEERFEYSSLEAKIIENKTAFEGVSKRLDDIARNQSRWIWAIVIFFLGWVVTTIAFYIMNLPTPPIP